MGLACCLTDLLAGTVAGLLLIVCGVSSTVAKPLFL